MCVVNALLNHPPDNNEQGQRSRAPGSPTSVLAGKGRIVFRPTVQPKHAVCPVGLAKYITVRNVLRLLHRISSHKSAILNPTGWIVGRSGLRRSIPEFSNCLIVLRLCRFPMSSLWALPAHRSAGTAGPFGTPIRRNLGQLPHGPRSI